MHVWPHTTILITGILQYGNMANLVTAPRCAITFTRSCEMRSIYVCTNYRNETIIHNVNTTAVSLLSVWFKPFYCLIIACVHSVIKCFLCAYTKSRTRHGVERAHIGCSHAQRSEGERTETRRDMSFVVA